MTDKDKILIVDDNPDIIITTRRTLEKHGFAVQEALSGRQAVSLLKGDLPKLVVLDVLMPGMNGLEVLSFIRKNPATAQLPVIMLTSLSQDADVLAGFQSGVDYYLTKPCTMKQLLYSIGAVLGRPDIIALGEEGN